MYTPWLVPSEVEPPAPTAAYSLFAKLSPAISATTRVALIGTHAPVADAVREQLYPLAWDFGNLEITDLGNLRKRSVDFAIPLLRELQAAGILPVLLGAGGPIRRAQYLAFAELSRQVGVFAVDQYVRISGEEEQREAGNFLDELVYRRQPPRFHLSCAGSQRHLIDPRLPALFTQRHYGLYPLGSARADLSELEPPIRDADVMMMDIGALARAEAPAQKRFHGSGLSLQEGSQLCFYAGNSDRLSSFGIYGFSGDPARGGEEVALTAAAYAQLCWYFLHGVSLRFGDFPARTDGMTEFVVDTRLMGKLTFWYSPRSTRWWVAVPADGQRGEARNRLVACSHRDYTQTSQEGKLPDRIINAFARY